MQKETGKKKRKQENKKEKVKGEECNILETMCTPTLLLTWIQGDLCNAFQREPAQVVW